MGIGKDHSPGRQLFHMRRLGLRVATQHTVPVIHIIDDQPLAEPPAVPSAPLQRIEEPSELKSAPIVCSISVSMI